MKYILILWMVGASPSIDHVEFDTKVACKNALDTVAKTGGTFNLHGVCVPKGDE